LSDIEFILLTHHHDDHAGLAARLASECDARIISHELELAPLEKGENVLPPPANRRAGMTYYGAKLSGGMTPFPPVAPTDKDIVISGDDDLLLRNIGIDGQILCTPGHTKGSISVLLDDGNAFVGDLTSNSFKLTGVKHRPFYVDSIDDLFSSWSKVLDAGAKTIHPVHGKPFPAERLRPLLERNKAT
jgi:glyoxylase-like metal-dependent hydrolase (beta-lactamase superfamily II)